MIFQTQTGFCQKSVFLSSYRPGLDAENRDSLLPSSLEVSYGASQDEESHRRGPQGGLGSEDKGLQYMGAERSADFGNMLAEFSTPR